jgi:hypothetical protein
LIVPHPSSSSSQSVPAATNGTCGGSGSGGSGSGGSGNGGGGGSALGYLATAFLCLILGALIGVFGFIFYNKWQQKKADVHYGSVPTSDDGDLLGDDI